MTSVQVSKVVPVVVVWETWRLERPPGSKYSTLCLFPDKTEADGNWSMNLEFPPDQVSATNPQWRGHAHFLVSEAPQEWLVSGAEFRMAEGPRISALVRVL